MFFGQVREPQGIVAGNMSASWSSGFETYRVFPWIRNQTVVCKNWCCLILEQCPKIGTGVFTALGVNSLKKPRKTGQFWGA